MTDQHTRRPLPLRAVRFRDGFWAPRQESVRARTIPHQEHQLRTGGQFAALELAWKPGEQEPHIFWESDIGKWIEAASYSLAKHPDAALEASVDEAIALLASAEQPDGYLNSYFTTVKAGHRFTDLRDAHELYCLGHLIEGAVAHHQATGKTSFLDIVRRYADLVDREFGPGGSAEGGYDGHEEIELALVKLARETGEPRYLRLALRLVDARGRQPFYFDAEEERRGTAGYFGGHFPEREEEVERFRQYTQSHEPVREQSEAVGHSVRAMYLYSAMTDLAVEFGDAELLAACERLWQNLTERKLYVTGGIGSDPSIEGFSEDFDLPNDTNYNETCASIGLVLWAHRMSLATGDARYIDVLERALYNTVLAGAAADGTHYFYGNPMESDGGIERSEWFGVACCPPNYARLMTSLEQYAYAVDDQSAVVNLFVAGEARFPLRDREVRLEVTTLYPWEGRVELRVLDAGEFSLAVRVPSWAEGVTATVAGTAVDVEPAMEHGYLVVRRDWQPGDTVVLELPLEVRRVWAHPLVVADVGLVALERGPLVYCVESIDNAQPVAALALPRDAEFETEWDEELGVVALVGDAVSIAPEPGPLYRSAAPAPRPTRLRAIPYFAWANRGRSAMRVWLRDLVAPASPAVE